MTAGARKEGTPWVAIVSEVVGGVGCRVEGGEEEGRELVEVERDWLSPPLRLNHFLKDSIRVDWDIPF